MLGHITHAKSYAPGSPRRVLFWRRGRTAPTREGFSPFPSPRGMPEPVRTLSNARVVRGSGLESTRIVLGDIP